MCKQDMCCTLVAQHTCPRVTSESTGNEKHCLIFTHFVSIENAMLCLPEHLFACSHLLKALKAFIIFNLIQTKIKDQLSRTKNQFQVP